MRPALLVLDPENNFPGGDNSKLTEFERTVPSINAAIALFHEHNLPVIFILQTSYTERHRSPARAIYKAFDCWPQDSRLDKSHHDAFKGTGLDLLLSGHDVDSVVVAGYLAECCVATTYHAALARDYRAAILEDGTPGLDEPAGGPLANVVTVSLANLRQNLHTRCPAVIPSPFEHVYG